MKRELFALSTTLLILVAFPASLFGYQIWRTKSSDARVIDLVANAPADGGWQPDTIRVNLGERVQLRISSPDVVHGFAVPALGLNVDEINPGHVEEAVFVATRPGRFPFACTRWCSVDHWRMRGMIEVIDPANPNAPLATPAAPPLYQQLGIDLDAMHAANNVPAQTPSSARGAALNVTLPSYTQDVTYLHRNPPSDLFGHVRGEAQFKAFSDEQVWDLIALAFERASGAGAVSRGRQLYARDCAACHGETGKGDGPAGANLPGLTAMHPEMTRGPADFTNAAQMLGASDVLLQGKMLRGGMGTGMPEWGSLHTEQDMWDLVGYLRSFVFDYSILHR